MTTTELSQLDLLEAEGIHVMREVAATGLHLNSVSAGVPSGELQGKRIAIDRDDVRGRREGDGIAAEAAAEVGDMFLISETLGSEPADHLAGGLLQ